MEHIKVLYQYQPSINVQPCFHVIRVFIIIKISVIPYPNNFNPLLQYNQSSAFEPCISRVEQGKVIVSNVARHRCASAFWPVICKAIDKTICPSSFMSPKSPLFHYTPKSRAWLAYCHRSLVWWLNKTMICIEIASFRGEFRNPLLPHTVKVYQSLYFIVVGSRRLMPPDALQPKAYCTNPGL